MASKFMKPNVTLRIALKPVHILLNSIIYSLLYKDKVSCNSHTKSTVKLINKSTIKSAKDVEILKVP